MSIFNGYFSGKKILVTGHTGFKGAWLTLWLKELGAEVTGYSLEPPTEPNLFSQLGLSEKIHCINGDVRDLNQLQQAVTQTQPEIIFHLAAQSLVRASYSDSIDTVSTNILGTANLLEAVRRSGSSVRVCQIVSSDKCYENNESGRPHLEGDRLGGHDLYSASKACSEMLVSAYRNSFFANPSQVSLSSVRAGNVIGGGDWSRDRILPDCIRALQKNEPILVRNPKSIRPWQYVLDALSGYLLLAQRQGEGLSEFASAWNFGPDSSGEWTVAVLADCAIQEWGSGSWTTRQKINAEPHEAQFLRLDPSKANTVLEWRTLYSPEESVRETVRWYLDTQKSGADEIYQYSVKQIKTFTAKASDEKLQWATQEKVLR